MLKDTRDSEQPVEAGVPIYPVTPPLSAPMRCLRQPLPHFTDHRSTFSHDHIQLLPRDFTWTASARALLWNAFTVGLKF